MPSNRYYFNEGTFIADINGTDVPVGEARRISIMPAADHNRFYGPDSIQFQDVKRSRFRVDVDIEIAEFDEAWVQYWLQGSDSTSSTINDANDVAQFNITAEQEMSSGDFKLKAIVNETDFEEIPAIDGTEDEYISHQLTGTGKAITFTNVSV